MVAVPPLVKGGVMGGAGGEVEGQGTKIKHMHTC